MKTRITMTSLLFLSAVAATPALANYFHNPRLNMMFNVGSAPSPTPQDIREHRMPQLTDTNPSHSDDVAADTTKTSGKTDQTYSQVGERKNVPAASAPQ